MKLLQDKVACLESETTIIPRNQSTNDLSETETKRVSHHLWSNISWKKIVVHNFKHSNNAKQRYAAVNDLFKRKLNLLDVEIENVKSKGNKLNAHLLVTLTDSREIMKIYRNTIKPRGTNIPRYKKCDKRATTQKIANRKKNKDTTKRKPYV